MKPLGLRPYRNPSKQDVHPRKPHINWWEGDEIAGPNKTRAKREAKQEIRAEIAHLKAG